MPSIGSLSVFAITNAPIQRGQALVTDFSQFGVDSVGVIIGAKRQKTSTLTSISFVATRALADQLIRDSSDIVGTAVTIIRDASGNSIANCIIKGVDVMESKAVRGAVDSWCVVLSWTLLAPVDW